MLSAHDKKAISEARMAKAREFLADARATYQDHRYRTSVNRAYYAALNAARSLLILEGANPGTHEGTVTLLNLRLVKTGILPVGVLKQFKALLSRRTDVDYGDFDTIDAEEAEASLNSAKQIVETLDTMRNRMFRE